MENKKQAVLANGFNKNNLSHSKGNSNLLFGDQFFTEQLSPNSSLFDFSEIT
jgi:hypothetical protein